LQKLLKTFVLMFSFSSLKNSSFIVYNNLLTVLVLFGGLSLILSFISS
jgi:hypothetical protein